MSLGGSELNASYNAYLSELNASYDAYLQTQAKVLAILNEYQNSFSASTFSYFNQLYQKYVKDIKTLVKKYMSGQGDKQTQAKLENLLYSFDRDLVKESHGGLFDQQGNFRKEYFETRKKESEENDARREKERIEAEMRRRKPNEEEISKYKAYLEMQAEKRVAQLRKKEMEIVKLKLKAFTGIKEEQEVFDWILEGNETEEMEDKFENLKKRKRKTSDEKEEEESEEQEKKRKNKRGKRQKTSCKICKKMTDSVDEHLNIPFCGEKCQRTYYENM